MTSHASPLSRYSVSLLIAAVTTLMLLWIMQDLIKHDGNVPTAADPAPNLTIVRLPEEVEIVPEQDIEPPLPPEPPPLHLPRIDGPETGDGPGFEFEPPTADTGKPTIAGGLPDGDMLPIVKVSPVYPNRAQTRGLEGYVLLEFTVDETGAVRDPRVVESSSAIFDRSALNAVLRFKYKPRVINGAAVRVEGVLHRLTYELNGD